MNGKFRVWSDVLKQYLNEGKLLWNIKMDCDGYLHVRNEYNHSVPGKLVVEHCTGLSASKSYRGKEPEDLEIYVGDILRLDATYNDGTHARFTREIHWFQNRCGFFMRDFPFDDCGINSPAAMRWCERAEIIGTIHEEVKK